MTFTTIAVVRGTDRVARFPGLGAVSAAAGVRRLLRLGTQVVAGDGGHKAAAHAAIATEECLKCQN